MKYAVKAEAGVSQFDFKLLQSEFLPDAFIEMFNRYEQVVRSIAADPFHSASSLEGPLKDMLCVHWESGPIPNHDPWPDMRLAYTVDEKQKMIIIWGVGRRNPRNRTSDFYTTLTARKQNK